MFSAYMFIYIMFKHLLQKYRNRNKISNQFQFYLTYYFNFSDLKSTIIIQSIQFYTNWIINYLMEIQYFHVKFPIKLPLKSFVRVPFLAEDDRAIAWNNHGKSKLIPYLKTRFLENNSNFGFSILLYLVLQ